MENKGDERREEGITDSEHFSPYRADGKLVCCCFLLIGAGWKERERGRGRGGGRGEIFN
jgi:hypothetical protein